jgi:hypothetical protein
MNKSFACLAEFRNVPASERGAARLTDMLEACVVVMLHAILSFKPMQSMVFGLRQYHQILKSVVVLNSIYVMDMLVRPKLSAKMFLHDVAVLLDHFAIVANALLVRVLSAPLCFYHRYVGGTQRLDYRALMASNFVGYLSRCAGFVLLAKPHRIFQNFRRGWSACWSGRDAMPLERLRHARRCAAQKIAYLLNGVRFIRLAQPLCVMQLFNPLWHGWRPLLVSRNHTTCMLKSRG